MKVVRFLRSGYLSYQAGETAGFDDATADGLIARGMAVDKAAADAKAKADAEAAEAVAKAKAEAGESAQQPKGAGPTKSGAVPPKPKN